MRAIIFDFDGTLAETRVAVSTTINAALHAAGLPRVHPPFIHHLMGLPLDQLVGRLIPPTQTADVPALIAWYREHFPTLGEPHVHLLPGVTDLLDAVRARGLHTAIATSREGSSLMRLLDHLGIRDRFDALSSCDQVAQGKPAPDLLQHALCALDVHPADAVLLGDTAWDMQMAIAAGCRAVGVLTGEHDRERLLASGATAVIPDLTSAHVALNSLDELRPPGDSVPTGG